MATLILNEEEGPGTHLLLIGVGRYPHLVGGKADEISEQAHGMKQLTSPPVSVEKILEWFRTEHRNLAAPLKSIEVLVSAQQSLHAALPGGQVVEIQKATTQNVTQAAKRWSQRLNSHEENVGIFYFCGHGVGDGVGTHLLLEDYGSQPNAILNSIDFQKFHIAMGECGCQNQCYFIDTCRTINSTLLLNAGTRGTPLLSPNVTKVYSGSHPTFFSAKQGESTFAEPNQASFFAQALVEGISKYGSGRSRQGRWPVTAPYLLLSMNGLLKRSTGSKAVCIVDSMDSGTFALHEMNGSPEVLIEVTCNPKEANSTATFAWKQNGTSEVRDDATHPWFVSVPRGPCTVEATFPAGSKYKGDKWSVLWLTPPHEEAELSVL